MRRTVRQLFLCACALAVVLPAQADFKRSYGKGLDAAASNSWDEVEARMKEAMAEDATPRAGVKLYGQRFETYVPQYYLGLVAYKRGDCSTALRYWESPGLEAVVQADTALSGPAQSGLRDCRGKVASVPPPAKPPITTVAANTDNEKPPTKVEPKPASTDSGTNVASNTPSPSTTTTPPVKPPVPPPVPAPVPPPVPAVEVINAPAELVSALDNYLSGRYVQAAAIDPSRLSDNRARYHALIVRAASRYIQAQLQSGDAGKTLLGQAEVDVRGAKQIQPSTVPDATLFPPKFLQFYSVTR
jgi:hypothetical protein